MNYWIDTHAHIYLDEFSGDREEMLSRCTTQGVERIFMPNIDHTSIDSMLRLEEDSKGICHAMMGLHPCSVKKDFENELLTIEKWLKQREFAAVGEIGTDLYWDKTFWEQQKEAFIIQVNWAKEFKLPIVIHCRESLDQTIELIEGLQDGTLKGIFHCFGGTIEQAERICKLGFFLGIGGVVTFKKSGLDQVLPRISLENLVLETDSPYLAPVPYRGKRNEPSYLPIIAEKIAEFKDINVQEVKSITSQNALKLFNQSI
jgi:TatD DNase family protein